MPSRAYWLAAFLAVGASPSLAAGRLPQAPTLARHPTLVVAAENAPVDPVAGWAAIVRGRLVNAVVRLRRKMPRGTLVKVAFTVTETGQLEAIRGEGEPRAVEQVLAAVRGVGHVPAPPDHKAHAITVPIRVQ